MYKRFFKTIHRSVSTSFLASNAQIAPSTSVLPSPALVKPGTNHFQEVDSVNAFSKITDPENPLRLLSAENNLELYSKWDDALLLRLRLEDWHRIFENITPKDWDSVKISQEIKDQSLHLFAKMKSLGVTPDAFIYSTLFKIFSDDWKQVQEFYRFIFRITKDNLTAQVKTPNTLLNNRSYQILLEIYNAKHTNYELSLLNLWDDVKMTKIKLTRETYLAFLQSKGIEKTGDFVSTLHQKLKWRKIVLKEKWDLQTYAALMNAYSLIGLYDVVDRLYVDMKHERIKLSRECYTSYLRVLEIKNRYKRILVIQNEMDVREDVYENKSIEILLNASLEQGKIENIKYLYNICCQEYEKRDGITWRSFESFLRIYAKLGKIEECNQVYQKYKELRLKVSSEYNQKYNLSRPTSDLEQSSFSRLYMLPEPPRDILYHMAYALGYNRDVHSIKKFFMEEVFDHKRLTLYHYRKQLGTSKDLKLEIARAQKKINNIRYHKTPDSGSLIKKYKDNISKCNKSLKNFTKLEVGLEGPVGIVYEGLREGWKQGLQDLNSDDIGSYYVQMDELVYNLTDLENYQATDLESKYPPPFFPPQSKPRYHPYSSRSVSQRAATGASQFRVYKQAPQTIGWISAKFEEIKDDLVVSVGKLSYPNYNEFSMEELVEKLNSERLKASKISKDLFMTARSLSNPYELIYKSRFKNSDAVKLANLDKLASIVTNETFSFVSIGKSSGFAEYVFFRRPNAKGFGVNVENDSFTGKDFVNSQVKDWDGISKFYQKILHDTKGVDFVAAMTDTSDFSGDELYGEFHSKRMLISQLYGMFSVLRVGGDFILRMFDLNTTFSIDVVYILYRYFSKIAICKPCSSRACENERFIICKGLCKSAPDSILKHLSEAKNSFLQDLGSKVIPFKDQVRSSVSDVLSLIRPGVVSKDEDFIDSIQGSNMKLVIREREALEDLLRYAGKTMTLGYDQLEIKNRCFQEWRIDG